LGGDIGSAGGAGTSQGLELEKPVAHLYTFLGQFYATKSTIKKIYVAFRFILIGRKEVMHVSFPNELGFYDVWSQKSSNFKIFSWKVWTDLGQGTTKILFEVIHLKRNFGE
jgi:hypothetical protein